MMRAQDGDGDSGSNGSPEGVFDARAEQVARLIELGTSGEGLPSSESSLPTPLSGSDSFAVSAGFHDRAHPPEVPGYQITGMLGEGGMGTVWRALQRSTRREVALKLVGRGAIASHRSRLRFEREVELASKLEHPNIARVYDSGMSRGLYYYAMELVEGRHLDQYVQDEKLGRDQVLALFRDVCLAVQHAHQRGVIHRDLKPSNILVTADGTPKVLDFGLAKAVDESPAQAGLSVTLEGQWAGTPAFMSPEQAAGKSGADRPDTRTDVYGLGATLYFILTGQHPHDQSGPRYEVLRRLASEEARAPRSVRPDLDAELQALLLRAMERDPERRYPSPAELARDIDRFLGGEPLVAKPPKPLYVLRKRLRKHWLPLTTAIGVVLILVALGLWAYERESEQRRTAERHSEQVEDEREIAIEARRQAEINLAQARLAEGDALLATDQVGQAKVRYEEARVALQHHGTSTFTADVALWDAHRRSPPPLMELIGHTALVNCVVYLPGGRGLVSGSEDGTVRFWDALTGRCTRVLENVGRVQRLAVSPDGNVLALAGVGRGLTLWNIGTGRPAGDLQSYVGEPTSVAFSADGRHLLVGTTDLKENTYLFDHASGQLVRTFTGHAAAVRDAAFTPDGRVAITVSGRPPPDVEVGAGVRAWDVADGRQLWYHGLGRSTLNEDIAISPDGSSIFSGASSGRVHHWDRHGAAVRGTVMDAGAEVLSVAISPDGALLATATRTGLVEVRHSPSGDPLVGEHSRTLFFGGERSVTFSPDARFLAAAGADRVLIWPLIEPGIQRDFGSTTFPGTRDTNSVSFSPDGRLALSSDFFVRLWDVETGWCLSTIESSQVRFSRPTTSSGGYEHDATAAFLLPDGRSIVLAERDGTLGVWDLGLKNRLRGLEDWEGHKALAVSVAPDGRYALVRFFGSDELQLYDLPTGTRLRPLKLDGARLIDRMVFSPGSDLAAACSREGIVKVWETTTGRERHAWHTGGAPVHRVAFSPDGSILACAGDGVHVFDVSTGEILDSSRWPVGQLWSVAFTPNRGHGGVGMSSAVGYFGVIGPGSLRKDAPSPSRGSVDFAWKADPVRVLTTQGDQWGLVRLLELSYPATLRRLQPKLAAARTRLARHPDDREALRVVGEWYVFRGVWDHAADLLERARAAGAEVPPLTLGRCYWMDRNKPAAIRELRTALERAEDEVEAEYLRLCLGAVERYQPHRAPASWDDAYLKHPYVRLGRRLAKAEWQLALRLFDGAFRLSGGDRRQLAALEIMCRERLAFAQPDAVTTQLFPEVVALAEQDLETHHLSYAEACRRLGLAHYCTGAFQQSVEWFEKALAGPPRVVQQWVTETQVWLYYGDGLWRLGRRDDAVRAWQQPLARGTNQYFENKVKQRLQAVAQGEEPPLEPVTTTSPQATQPVR